MKLEPWTDRDGLPERPLDPPPAEAPRGGSFPVRYGPSARADRKPPASGWGRAGLLFAATLVTTFSAGAVMTVGAGPGSSGPAAWIGWFLEGRRFALPLLFILLCHEFGHYLAARYHGVATSPPYFIPFPNLIGTLGAFIAIRSPILNRRQLMDIGAAGPLAGFVPALFLLVWGYALSTVEPLPSLPEGFAVPVFGDSLLTLGIQTLFFGTLPEGAALFLHPMAFAGWVGMLVTMLNLLPVGQLDGGHIAYALLGRRQWHLAPFVLLLLLVLGVLGARWWWYILIFLMVLMGVVWVVTRIRYGPGIPLRTIWDGRMLRHPPVVNEEPLDVRRRRVGWIALAVFAVTFVPVPIRFLSG